MSLAGCPAALRLYTGPGGGGVKDLHLLYLAFALVPLAAGSAHAQSYTGIITLEPIPPRAGAGDPIYFSGWLGTASGSDVSRATVHVKDDVSFGRDTVIATLVTGSDGRFEGAWAAQPRGSGAWDLYAVFEGSPQVSGARSDAYSLRVSLDSGAASYGTSIRLDGVPGSVNPGDRVTFTGRLSAGGQPLGGATVKIYEDDPLSPDQRLGQGATGAGGRFSIAWTASAGLVEEDFDVYAVFDGDDAYPRARTANQTLSVLKLGGTIALDPLPGRAAEGDMVEFSGTLRLDGASPQGQVVYIKDEDPFSGDDLLAAAYVEGDGRFSAGWFAKRVDPDSTVDIYAVFEGDDTHYRLTTCDPDPTLGGSCPDTIPLFISDSGPARPGPAPAGDQYMELYYSMDLHQSPRVAIVPSPDSYGEVRGHIVPAQEGILMWKQYMEGRYGGDWDVTFEVVAPGSKFGSRPDVVVNLDTGDTHAGCDDYYGVASVPRQPDGPVQTTVCSTYGGERRSDADVSATAAHEFIHAVGLGHAFNKAGDMMCSAEDGVPTCDRLDSKQKTPSGLNLEAIAQLYGADGFRNPNAPVAYGDRFPAGAPAAPPAGNGGRCLDEYDVRVSLEPGWYAERQICGGGHVHYSFSASGELGWFEIYALPPGTDVDGFVNGGEGEYYTCEEYGEIWQSRSNTCDMEAGSSIVVLNVGDGAADVRGHVRIHEDE